MTVDPCSLPPQTGDCKAHLPSWYYQSATDRCIQFVYGGCGGNANRFVTKDACNVRCRIKVVVTGLGKLSPQSRKPSCPVSVSRHHHSWYAVATSLGKPSTLVDHRHQS